MPAFHTTLTKSGLFKVIKTGKNVTYPLKKKKKRAYKNAILQQGLQFDASY